MNVEYEVGKDILATALNDNGTLTAQLGDVVTKDVDSYNVEIWGPLGFAARPPKPEAGVAAAQAVILTGSDRDIGIAFRDTRGQDIYGNLGAGDGCVYARGHDNQGQARVWLDGNVGAVTLSTTEDNTKDGAGVYLRVSSVNGGTFEVQTPFGSLVMDAAGLHYEHVSGACFDIGSISLPAPLSVVGTYCTFRAGIFTADCPITMLGPSPLSGGKGYFNASYRLIPQPATFAPGLGAGVGAVVLDMSGSTKVFIGA